MLLKVCKNCSSIFEATIQSSCNKQYCDSCKSKIDSEYDKDRYSYQKIDRRESLEKECKGCSKLFYISGEKRGVGQQLYCEQCLKDGTYERIKKQLKKESENKHKEHKKKAQKELESKLDCEFNKVYSLSSQNLEKSKYICKYCRTENSVPKEKRGKGRKPVFCNSNCEKQYKSRLKQEGNLISRTKNCAFCNRIFYDKSGPNCELYCKDHKTKSSRKLKEQKDSQEPLEKPTLNKNNINIKQDLITKLTDLYKSKSANYNSNLYKENLTKIPLFTDSWWGRLGEYIFHSLFKESVDINQIKNNESTDFYQPGLGLVNVKTSTPTEKGSWSAFIKEKASDYYFLIGFNEIKTKIDALFLCDNKSFYQYLLRSNHNQKDMLPFAERATQIYHSILSELGITLKEVEDYRFNYLRGLHYEYLFHSMFPNSNHRLKSVGRNHVYDFDHPSWGRVDVKKFYEVGNRLVTNDISSKKEDFDYIFGFYGTPEIENIYLIPIQDFKYSMLLEDLSPFEVTSNFSIKELNYKLKEIKDTYGLEKTLSKYKASKVYLEEIQNDSGLDYYFTSSEYDENNQCWRFKINITDINQYSGYLCTACYNQKTLFSWFFPPEELPSFDFQLREFHKTENIIFKKGLSGEEVLDLENENLKFQIWEKGIPLYKKEDYLQEVDNLLKLKPQLKFNNHYKGLINSFFNHRYHYTTHRNSHNAFQWVYKPGQLEVLINAEKKYRKSKGLPLILKAKDLRRVILRRGETPPNFPPQVAKYIYENYLEGSTVLDPCAGFGARLLAAYCSKNDQELTYIGVEPNTKTYQGLTDLRSFLLKNYREPKNIQLYNSAYEDWCAEELKEKVDLIFTSPPYFNLEEYGLEKSQSSNKYPEYGDWVEGFLTNFVKNSLSYLRVGGKFIINTKNLPQYAIYDDLKKVSNKLGFKFIEEHQLKMSKAFYQKNHQYEMIGVWEKV